MGFPRKTSSCLSFSALSSFVCSATGLFYGQLPYVRSGVSVPSRALCVLRPGNHRPSFLISMLRFSALSSFVCSATLRPRHTRQRTAVVSVPSRALCVLRLEGRENVLVAYEPSLLRFSALSSFVCSATRVATTACRRAASMSIRFQCPLELCVFCDATSSAAARVEVGGQRFQCPLELCVFCDTVNTATWGQLTACFSALSSFVCSATWHEDHVPMTLTNLGVSVPSRALCVLRLQQFSLVVA